MTDLQRDRFIERLAKAWKAPALSPAERTAFAARVWERVEQEAGRRRRLPFVAAATLAAAAVVLFAVWPAENPPVDWVGPLVDAQAVLEGSEEDTGLGWGGLDVSEEEDALLASVAPEYQAVGAWMVLARVSRTAESGDSSAKR
jgi:hypothetical protein